MRNQAAGTSSASAIAPRHRERRRRLVVLDLREVADVQAAPLGDVGERQAALGAPALDLRRRRRACRSRSRSFVTFGSSSQTDIDNSLHPRRMVVSSNKYCLMTAQTRRATRRNHAMDIAIIGAGNVGKALATVVHAGRPQRHDRLARSRGRRQRRRGHGRHAPPHRTPPRPTAADIVILAVPSPSLAEVAAEIAAAVAGKPVVDVTNRIAFGADGPEIDTTSSNAEALAALLPEQPGRQGVQHALRVEPGRPDRRRHPARRLRRRRRRRRQGARSSSSSARSASTRSTSARSSGAPARGPGLPEHDPQHRATAAPGSRAGSSSARRRRRPRSAGVDDRGRHAAASAQTTAVSIPVARLNHAVLYVRDATAAAEFYGRVFGFEVVESAFGGRAVFMRAGERRQPPRPRPVLGRAGRAAAAAGLGRALPPRLGGPDHRRPRRRGRGPVRGERALGGASDHGVSASRSTAPTRTATSSRSCGASRARRGASTRTKGAVMPLDLDAEVRRWGAEGAARA